MSDDADRADAKIDAAIAAGIEQSRRAPALLPKGRCWYCDERVDAIRRFCDKTCAEDFEAEEEAMKRAGR
jgi:hypothetical protein